MGNLIEPRVLKGFRDFLPPDEIMRRDLIEKIERSFRSYGFVPIDTPALEYAEILLGKGGGETDKQVFRFTDHGKRDVALRYDLTVPLARFLAEHHSRLSFPFKRYHIGKAWRGENPQRGRYREFFQCDFDIIGSDSAASDFEILHMMQSTLSSLNCGGIEIRMNHRGIFNDFLSKLSLTNKSVEILRTVDKLAKIGREKCLELLSEITEEGEKIINFIEIKGSFDETLKQMTELAGVSPHSERLTLIYNYLGDAGLGISGGEAGVSFILDPSITRGLDYYTGIVFETLLSELPSIGSICSGGRYDNLVSLYSKEELKGIGASIGIDRLIAGMEALGKLRKKESYAKLAIACLGEKKAGLYQKLAGLFRAGGIDCEVFLEADKPVKQYQLAEKKGIRWLILDEDEAAVSGYTQDLSKVLLSLRDLPKRETKAGLSTDEIKKIIMKDGWT